MAETTKRPATSLPSHVRLDEHGKIIWPTEAEQNARLERMREAFREIESEGVTSEELAAEIAVLREIDAERAARGERPLFEGCF
jgi:hypothetical protein